MSNTNCLEGIRCPDCGNEAMFRIGVTATAHVTDDGAVVEEGEIRWDETSHAECPACEEWGLLSHFMTRPPAAAPRHGEPEPTRAELLRFLSDFVAFGCDLSGRDHWDGMSQFLEHARRLLRQSKGRRPA